MNVTGLVRFFEQRRERGEPLALVTIYETSGSTYSKAGAHMLIDGDGDFHGMLSGGRRHRLRRAADRDLRSGPG